MQQVITLTLVIKDDDGESARQSVVDRLSNPLNLWMIEDIGAQPFPPGSLLHWNVQHKVALG
jgi:hypothetical protein